MICQYDDDCEEEAVRCIRNRTLRIWACQEHYEEYKEVWGKKVNSVRFSQKQIKALKLTPTERKELTAIDQPERDEVLEFLLRQARVLTDH
jgi:hypothetical protein